MLHKNSAPIFALSNLVLLHSSHWKFVMCSYVGVHTYIYIWQFYTSICILNQYHALISLPATITDRQSVLRHIKYTHVIEFIFIILCKANFCALNLHTKLSSYKIVVHNMHFFSYFLVMYKFVTRVRVINKICIIIFLFLINTTFY